MQTPLRQVSVWVQALPSVQATPSALSGALPHTPVAGLQVPALWQESGATHTTGEPPRQPPFWQVSPAVQPLESLQMTPLAFCGLVQVPVAGRQVP